MHHAFKSIANTGRTRLVLWEADSDFTLVTFAPTRPLSDDRFWGDLLAKKAGIRTLSFIPANAHTYPVNDMAALLDQARDVLVGHRAISYGFSMGAYGALKYSAALGVDTALAFSPQSTINPDKTGDRRFVSIFSAADHTDMEIKADDLAGKCLIVADKRVKWDHHAAQEIAAMSPDKVRYAPVSHSGHGTVMLMLNTAFAMEVLKATDHPLDSMFARITPLLFGRKKISANYYNSLSLQAFKSGRVSLARRICELGIERTQAPVLYPVMGQYLVADDPQKAIDYLSTTGAIRRSPKAMMVTARAHRLLGNVELAETFRKQAREAKGAMDLA